MGPNEFSDSNNYYKFGPIAATPNKYEFLSIESESLTQYVYKPINWCEPDTDTNNEEASTIPYCDIEPDYPNCITSLEPLEEENEGFSVNLETTIEIKIVPTDSPD